MEIVRNIFVDRVMVLKTIKLLLFPFWENPLPRCCFDQASFKGYLQNISTLLQ